MVSALLFAHSKPGQALRHALKRGHVLVSSSTVGELAEVLQRAKFKRYVTAAEREEFLVAFVEPAILVEPAQGIRACRDAKDNKFLELAITGHDSYLITGDDDLLVLHPFHNLAIVTPAGFLQAVEKETPAGRA